MFDTITEPSTGESKDETSKILSNPDQLVQRFLLQTEPVFARLTGLREKGWANPAGDAYFQKQRSRADTADRNCVSRFYTMMQQIGDELQRSTGALRQTPEEGVKILDLCMAPRGYTASALKYNPGATAFGITLPPAQGGHEILFESSQSSVILLDVTMLVKEFGTENPPRTHPEYASGQVLRQHQRLGYRENKEPLRLTVSQLILALQRIRRGGTLIMLLHKIEAWHTLELLYDFSRFSSIQAFKPKKKHAIRSSFYLIAKNVQPDSDVARVSVEKWKIAWRRATFGANCEADEGVVAGSGHVKSVLDQFGNEYVKLGRPIWEIQAEALSKMDFTK